MKQLNKVLLVILLIGCTSCLGDQKSNAIENSEDEYEQLQKTLALQEAEAEKITECLCNDFPTDLIMKYNTDAKRVEIERVELVPEKLAHCKIKLFYGDKEYEYWEGQVSAWVPKTDQPFFQYNPERNASLYHKVDGIGEKAVFISNTYQLLILKDGIMHSIVPPNRGRTTNTGKENKEIALELAAYYQL
ncbi:hypothetical protein LX97_01341 [Nonlabens dokdonensis]|jgi:hypothetical protein|uniref:Uncharacterized protein n=2 Tax=Nonlabens dokdonensis TaxID=328515 RepID=L7WA11_NONDD|nr:hypothetical protein [Nonlabens dokdonensis]AGC76681.1 hypothetical protein DDD_1554 [Nonlabens dokdonensis DSW-6]PZX44330.1 hypothetical protein LX97_01341 [Nonlabens dokdonensis]